MRPIKLVLCPVDFSDLAQQELTLAVDVCETFGARLLVHHNLSSVPPGLTRAWEWNELHQEGYVSEHESETRLRKLVAGLPPGLGTQASVSHGPLATVLIEMASSLPADLVVLGSHGLSGPDHASVTERLIDRSVCPVLTLHPGVRLDRFHLRGQPDGSPTPVLVLTDLASQAPAVTSYAFDLARKAALHIHLAHIIPAGSTAHVTDDAQARLKALVPSDLTGRCTCHVEHGEAVDVAMHLADRLAVGFIVMGEHSRGFLLRLFIRDTAQALLHKAACPVWYVPPAR